MLVVGRRWFECICFSFGQDNVWIGFGQDEVGEKNILGQGGVAGGQFAFNDVKILCLQPIFYKPNKIFQIAWLSFGRVWPV